MLSLDSPLAESGVVEALSGGQGDLYSRPKSVHGQTRLGVSLAPTRDETHVDGYELGAA